MKKTVGYIAFVLLLVLAVVMGLATWMERLKGTEYVFSHFYKTVWFNLLWAWLAVSAGYYIVKTGLYKKMSVLILHFSLLIILIGAMITRFNGKTGIIHLRQGEEVGMFDCEEVNHHLPLPFSMKLKEFNVEYYPGTSSPSNYISVVEIKDNISGEISEQTISMNNILKYKSYRFYQSSFDKDMKGSLLSVNRDAPGIAVTYTGYYLLFFSMLWVLFDRRGRFFELWRRNFKHSKITRSVVIFLLFLPCTLYAQEIKDFNEITIDKDQAARFSKIWIDYHGRICPLQTLAIDYTTKITGKASFEGLSAEQFLLGWIFYSDEWKRVPLFEIKHPELKKLINSTGKACVEDFMDSFGEYKLALYWNQIRAANQTAILKEVAKLDEKVQLIAMLTNRSLLKVFPYGANERDIKWFYPRQLLSENSDESRQALVDHFFSAYKDEYSKDKKGGLHILELLEDYQQKVAGDVLPSSTHLKAELLYNKVSIFSLLFKIALTIGCLGMFIFIFYTIKNRDYKKLHAVFYGLLILFFSVLTIGIALRGYIAGRLPMSNGYETMLFIAWTALLVGVLFRRSSFLMTNFSLLLSGFTLLVAHISAMNPYITPLVPVLQSPLLSIHVSLIMFSYGLCGFMLLNSLTSFLLMIFSGKKSETKQIVVDLKEMSELFMFPATFLLGAGIFVGAIWANVSWGRYWGWDPKEVWALITFMLMSFSFHGKTISWFKKPVFYHIFVIIIFLSVLMTYFGVNYILGGKHSYAG